MKKLLLGLLVASLALIGPLHGQTNVQFPNTPWNGYAPARIQCGVLTGVNFNVTTDTAIPISVPSATWSLDSIVVDNPSVSMTTAQGGVYSGAGKTGITVVANTQAYSGLTAATANTTGNYLELTLSTAGLTTEFNGFAQTSQISTLYFSLTTGQGAAATADVRIYCKPHYG